jgi:hypothetical protein
MPCSRSALSNDVSVPPSKPAEHDITCRALHLPLVATQLQVAWHAGILDADSAMRSLDAAVGDACGLRAVQRNPNDLRPSHLVTHGFEATVDSS